MYTVSNWVTESLHMFYPADVFLRPTVAVLELAYHGTTTLCIKNCQYNAIQYNIIQYNTIIQRRTAGLK